MKSIGAALAVLALIVMVFLLLANARANDSADRGRSEDSQHYDPTARNELTSDVYFYMYDIHVSKDYRREDRTNEDEEDDTLQEE